MRLLNFYLTIAVASLCFPLQTRAHEAPLDRYGCHFHGKYYECHKGDFLGLSFDSKAQMLDRLRLQYLAFNRPWPFDSDDRIAEEEITSMATETPATRAVAEPVKQKRKIPVTSAESSNPKVTTKSSTPATESQPSSVVTELSQRVQKAAALRGRPAGSQKPEAPLIDRIIRIESSGRAIFENLDGKRFYLGEDGKKVFLNQGKL